MKNKIIILFIILIMIINNMMPVFINAIEITEANLIYDHKISTHIMYQNANSWNEIKCGYICYIIDKEKYPAYCISHGLHGVDEEGDYTVTINDLLKDKQIYNTIINGYPYKTPSQLGVETIDDAYVATKQAINSVVLNRDVHSFYKAIDSKGEKIINAIYEISEQGKNGMKDNLETKININKVNSLTEYENYYYQEYTISANANISNYNVNISKFPEGTYVSDLNGVESYSFNQNEKFRILIPKEKLNTNILGEIEINAFCNVKPIFYGQAPKNNIQNYAITYKPNVEYKKKDVLDISTNTAIIKIIKRDEETLKPISNVEFELYKNNKVIKNVKTNDEGIASFDGLFQGEYTIKEIKSNSDYIENNDIYNITAEYNKVTEKQITNKHKKGNLKIIKVDKDNNDITLGGVEFDLINKNDNTVIRHLTTDANGEIFIENINTGDYILKETKTKREYNLCINSNLVVKWNETSEIIIENEKKKGKIKIIKEDSEHNEIKLKGVKFQVLDKNNRIIESIVTDNNGEAITSKLPIGEYKIKEISLGSNTEYIINKEDDLKVVNIEDNITTCVNITNEHKKGNLKIIKVDKDNNKIYLKNVRFEITDEDGYKYYGNTDATGMLKIEGIRTGIAKIKEIETGNGYILPKETYEIKIEYNECKEIVIENEKKKGSLEIYKKDDEENKAIPNVEFEILDAEQNIVERLVTDKSGYAISKRLPIGKYYLKEVKTGSKYILNEEVLNVEIMENQTTKLNITNKKKKGKINIIKLSSDDSELFNIKNGDKIANVTFEIYDENNKLMEKVTTNEEGIAKSNLLEVGRYKIKEIHTNDFYLLNKNEFWINIDENNQTKTIKIENEPIIPKIHIEKKGANYAKPNQEIKYEFDIKNIGNTQIESLTWKEYIPYNETKITKISTGIYNEELEYKIYYKTNKNNYKLLKISNTFINEYLDLNNINLENGEIITEIKVDYGEVSKDFKSIIKPYIYVKINNLNSECSIINSTDLIGKIKEHSVISKSQYETIIKEEKIIKKLPKTGG